MESKISVTPMTLSIADAVKLSGLSRTSIYNAMKSGELNAVKFKGKTIILYDDLRNFIHSLPKYEPKSAA